MALPFEAFSPSTISAGVEVWTWLIAAKPAYETAIMSEIALAWDSTIKHGRGMFSKSIKYGLYPVNTSDVTLMV